MKALAFCAVLACAACGGDAQTPIAAPVRAPQQLTEVVFALPKALCSGEGDVTQRVCTALEGAMIHAGYKMALVTDAHDFVLRPQVTFGREPSMFQRNINGRDVYDIRVRVVLSILQKDQVIDQGSTELVTPNDEPIGEHLMTPLTNGIGRSERIFRSAEQVVQQRTSPDDTKDREGDEKAWIAAHVEACRQPIKLDACDKVRLYLADHSEGTHVEDAKKALEAAQPAMEKLQKDENDWQRADADDCKSKRTPAACTGVELYVKFHPTGLHAKDARSLLNR